MKFDKIENPNYVATVVRVNDGDLYKVEGLDNLRGYSKFGMQALVSKDTEPGLYIMFSTEVQLSHDYAAANNLYRDSTLNRAQDQSGYLETNRRVKAIKLRQNRSESLLMPLGSLSYMLNQRDLSSLIEGDVFDSIDGNEVCRKYVVKEPRLNAPSGPKARVRRVDEKAFPEHLDSENYFRNQGNVPANAHVIVTQKLHGTSVRFGNVPVAQEQTWLQRIFRRPTRFEHSFVVGSRRVVKSIGLKPTTVGKDHFYADDLWTRFAAENKVAERVPANHVIYGELVGFTPDGASIQKNYTYGCAPKTAELYVYRVAMVADGHMVDYSDAQMRQWCNERGFKTVPLLWAGQHGLLDARDYLERRYADEGNAPWEAVPLSHPKLPDEGICVRYDGPHGAYVLKAKSPSFLEHETKLLDAGEEDTESAA